MIATQAHILNYNSGEHAHPCNKCIIELYYAEVHTLHFTVQYLNHSCAYDKAKCTAHTPFEMFKFITILFVGSIHIQNNNAAKAANHAEQHLFFYLFTVDKETKQGAEKWHGVVHGLCNKYWEPICFKYQDKESDGTYQASLHHSTSQFLWYVFNWMLFKLVKYQRR